MEEKNNFWEDLDGLIESMSKEERIVLGADLNGHVGEENIGNEEIMGRYGAGTRNKEGSMVVDFGKRMDLAIVKIKIRNENTKKIYKEKKSKAKKAVAIAKGRAYDNLYARLETKESEKELNRLA